MFSKIVKTGIVATTIAAPILYYSFFRKIRLPVAKLYPLPDSKKLAERFNLQPDDIKVACQPGGKIKVKLKPECTDEVLKRLDQLIQQKYSHKYWLKHAASYADEKKEMANTIREDSTRTSMSDRLIPIYVNKFRNSFNLIDGLGVKLSEFEKYVNCESDLYDLDNSYRQILNDPAIRKGIKSLDHVGKTVLVISSHNASEINEKVITQLDKAKLPADYHLDGTKNGKQIYFVNVDGSNRFNKILSESPIEPVNSLKRSI